MVCHTEFQIIARDVASYLAGLHFLNDKALISGHVQKLVAKTSLLLDAIFSEAIVLVLYAPSLTPLLGLLDIITVLLVTVAT